MKTKHNQSNAISSDTEYEDKVDVATASELDTLRGHFVKNRLSSQHFITGTQHPSYCSIDHENKCITSYPISWYIDTPQYDLRQNGASLRLRLTPGIENYFEFALKGNSFGTNGEGGIKRLEKEILKDSPLKLPEEFNKGATAGLMNLIKGKALTYYFATQVKRDKIAVNVSPLSNSDRIITLEVAFDNMKYKWGRKMPFGRSGPPNEMLPFNRVYGMYQIEIEAINEPWNTQNKSEFEVYEAIKLLKEELQNIANSHGITVKEQRRSKGLLGYQLMDYDGLEPKDQRITQSPFENPDYKFLRHSPHQPMVRTP